MAFEYDERRSGLEQREYEFAYGHDDDYSELGPDDSASQIGRAITTEDLRHGPRYREHPGDSYALQWANGSAPRPYSRPEYPTTPPSRRTSLRSSRLLTPTTFVPSRQDRVRYSWQSIHGDEPNRPRIHVIKIVSNTATASAGLPGGEAFGFSISPGGRRIACYNSARLFILQTAALPVNISQEYSLRRRPLAIEVVDEGGILAVLADEHTINVYDLSHHRVRRLKTFKPDFPTNAIALSPTGALLAAAYEGGVEIFSLDENALSTDRRAARSEKMDKLQFSEDGSTLLGTTTRINASATVVISVPVFPAAENNIPTHEELKEAWCTNMLEPANIVDSSHAVFLRENGVLNNEKLFAWNGAEDTFGILNTQDLQYNNVDFPVTISPPLSTCGGLGAAIHSLPAIDEKGDTIGMIVNDRTIRLYVVPHAEDETTKVEAHSIDHELDEEFGCPFSEVRWVNSSANLPAPKGDPSQVSGRLVVVSPGGVVDPNMPEESVQDVEGGRIILFDFDPQYAGQPGQTFTLTLGKAPPQTLDEQEMDVAQEVALVRRRTVNASQKINQRGITLGRAASTVNRTRSERQPNLQRPTSPNGSIQQSPVERAAPFSFNRGRSNQSELSFAAEALPDVDEANEAIEEPYDHNAPRSVVTLQRAASAANSHRIQTFEERAAESASARENGFLPLPEYTEEPNTPLPGRYRALAGLEQPKTLPKSASHPRLTNGAEDRPNIDALASQPSLDAIVAGPSTAQENTTRPFQTPPSNMPPALASGPVPRSLQRAYSNAVSPISVNTLNGMNLRTPPTNGGEWGAISPIQRNGNNLSSPAGSVHGPNSTVSQQSTVSPVVSGPNSPREPNRADIERRELERRERERLEQRARIENGTQSTLAPTPQAVSRTTPPQQQPQHPPPPQPQPRQTPTAQRQHTPPEAQPRLSNSHFAPVPLASESTSSLHRPSSEPAHPPHHGLTRSQSMTHHPITTTSTNTAPPGPSSAGPGSNSITTTSPRTTGYRRPAPPTPGHNHLPPHIVAMQDAFHSSNPHGASSSLFPLNPNARRHSAQPAPAGSVAHPITGWFPPAPSTSTGDDEDGRARTSSGGGGGAGRVGRLWSRDGGGAGGGGVGGRGRQGSRSRPGSVVSRFSRSSGRPSSAPPGMERGGKGAKKRWLGGRRTPRRAYFEDGTWVQDEGRRCVVM